MNRLRIGIPALAFLAFVVVSGAGAADYRTVLADIDRMSSFTDSDYSCMLTVVSEKTGEQPNIQQAQMFRRDKDAKAVILILKPEVLRGQGYLQTDDNLWFYDPESRKFAHTTMKDNFQDTDAKQSDFRPQSLERHYKVTADSEGELGKFKVHILDLEASSDEAVYPRMRLWVRQDNSLLLKAENYGLSGRLMRTAYYPSYIKLGTRYTASKMLFVDELRPGEKTQVTIKDALLSPIPDSVFTKSYIERVNR